MKYELVWTPAAVQAVEVVFDLIDDSDAVERAILDVDAVLSIDPHAQGESRDGAVRLWFQRPFCVLFSVDETAPWVKILGVKWVGS